MRKISDHKVNGLNEALEVLAIDEPGSGGANHVYQIDLWPSAAAYRKEDRLATWTLQFQNGPIQEAGFNGISNEALLVILIDRMRGFQNGQFKCRDNAVALTKLEEALMWLQKRTRERVARGVEGTHQV